MLEFRGFCVSSRAVSCPLLGSFGGGSCVMPREAAMGGSGGCFEVSHRWGSRCETHPPERGGAGGGGEEGVDARSSPA